MHLSQFPRSYRLAIAALCALLSLPSARADGATSSTSTDPAAASVGTGDNTVQKLDTVTVTDTGLMPDQYQLPQTTQSVTDAQIADTINAVDVEDALKYLPSLFVRKRNYGDNQPTLETRTWGVNSSARSLVYADGVLLSALIANNNSIGAPRWGMVAPEEIDRIDVLYGPFGAAYPGNSMGAVVEITTRMPTTFEATLSETTAFQDFSIYDTHFTSPLSQTGATLGDRIGKWSYWISAEDEFTHSQPLTFVTAGSVPAGTSGAIIAWNKLGQPADVLGASNVQDSNYVNAKIKVAYDFLPTLRATYSIGRWNNLSNATGQSYLTDASGNPTFGNVSGFAGSFYNWIEEQTMQSFSLKSSGAGDWDWQAIASLYDFDKDTEDSAAAVTSTGTGLSTTGKAAILGGTGWETLDLKAAWHPLGRSGGQELSFGVHDDEYKLVNPTYNIANWEAGGPYTSLATEGNGNTQTEAVWVQDAWQFNPQLKATVGGREEDWRAFDGINVNGATTVIQPGESSSNFSPKGTLAWSPTTDWVVTASVGEAYRYPTAAELYQLVSTGSTYTSPNPDLQPESDWSEELKAEHKLTDGTVRLSLFQEVVNNGLISQYQPLVPGSSTVYSYIVNVGKLRNRGVEFYGEKDNVLFAGLDLSGSVTYVDSRILEDAGAGQFTTAVGKRAPYVPVWRGDFVVTYRPTKDVALTVAGRYSGQQYSTVDNTDTNPNVYGGFDEFFVLDTHENWKINRHWDLSAGVDNILNRKYFLFHPFPQRTIVSGLKYSF